MWWAVTNQRVRFDQPLSLDDVSRCLILSLQRRRTDQTSDASISIFLRPNGHRMFVRVKPCEFAVAKEPLWDISFGIPRFLSGFYEFVELNNLQILGNAFNCGEFLLTESQPYGCWDPSTFQLHGGYSGIFRSHLHFGSRRSGFFVICLMNKPAWREQRKGWRCGLLRGDEWPDVQGQLHQYFEPACKLPALIMGGQKMNKVLGEGKNRYLVSLALGDELEITVESVVEQEHE